MRYLHDVPVSERIPSRSAPNHPLRSENQSKALADKEDAKPCANTSSESERKPSVLQQNREPDARQNPGHYKYKKDAPNRFIRFGRIPCHRQGAYGLETIPPIDQVKRGHPTSDLVIKWGGPFRPTPIGTI